jgi:hypothetical protein
MSRPLLVALVLVLAVMVVSWALGEALRQRKNAPGRSRRSRHR